MTVIAYAVPSEETRHRYVWVDVPSGVEYPVAYFVLAREDDAAFTVSDGEGTWVADTAWWVLEMSEADEVIEEVAPCPSLQLALEEYPELTWQFIE